MVHINKALEYTDKIKFFFNTASKINGKNDHFFIYWNISLTPRYSLYIDIGYFSVIVMNIAGKQQKEMKFL